MEKMLMEFIGRVMRTPELRKKFASCKNLKETYDKFKDELNGCSYETYKNFFKKAVATKSNLSVDELKNVSGGISLKTLLAPTALLAMFTAVPALAHFVGAGDISVGMVAHAAFPKTATTDTEEVEVRDEGVAPEQQVDGNWLDDVLNRDDAAAEGAAPEQQVDGNGLDDVLQPPPEEVRRVDSEAPLTVGGVNAQDTMFDASTELSADNVEVWDEGAAPEQRVDGNWLDDVLNRDDAASEGAAPNGNWLDDVLQPPPSKVRRVESEAPLTVDGVNALPAIFGANTNPFREPVDNSVVTDFWGGQTNGRAVPPAPAAVGFTAAVGGAEVGPSLSPAYFDGRDGVVFEKGAGSFKVGTIPPEYIAMTTTDDGLFRYINGRKQAKPSSTYSRIDGLGYRLCGETTGRPYVRIFASTYCTDNRSLHLIPFVDGSCKLYQLMLSETLLDHPLIVDANTLYAVRLGDGTIMCFWTTEPNQRLTLSKEGGKLRLKAGDKVLIDNLAVTMSRARGQDDALPDVSGGNGIRQCLDGISDTNGFKILDLNPDECGQGEARFVVGSEFYNVPVGASAYVTLSGLRYWRREGDNTVQVSARNMDESQGCYTLASCWENGYRATTQARPYAMSFSPKLNNKVFSLTKNTVYAIRCTSSERRDMPARVIVPQEDMSVRVLVPQEDDLHVMLVKEGNVWQLKRCLRAGKQWVACDDTLIDNVLTFSSGRRKLAE